MSATPSLEMPRLAGANATALPALGIQPPEIVARSLGGGNVRPVLGLPRGPEMSRSMKLRCLLN